MATGFLHPGFLLHFNQLFQIIKVKAEKLSFFKWLYVYSLGGAERSKLLGRGQDCITESLNVHQSIARFLHLRANITPMSIEGPCTLMQNNLQSLAWERKYSFTTTKKGISTPDWSWRLPDQSAFFLLSALLRMIKKFFFYVLT